MTKQALNRVTILKTPYGIRGVKIYDKNISLQLIFICRFKLFSSSTKYSYSSSSKPVEDSVDTHNRVSRVVSPSWFDKQVFINFILENKCSTQAILKGSDNDNFSKCVQSG